MSSSMITIPAVNGVKISAENCGLTQTTLETPVALCHG